MSKLNFLLALTFGLVLSSCKKPTEDPTPVNKEPSAAISVESESETLWNEVTVTVNASDADGNVSSVELYANNEWIGEDTEAPYEFTWDTKDFEDGDVELKAKVIDDLEAFAETFKTVSVMNTLINYDLYEGYLSMIPEYKYYTYITSKSKHVLHFEQIESLPYQATVVRPDDFDDVEFDVHFVQVNPAEGYLTSYSDLTPGIFAPVNDDLKGDVIGETNMTFTDIPEHDYYTFGAYASAALTIDKIYNAKVYENLDLGYLYLRDGSEGLYKMMDLTDGDESTSLSVTGFEMQEHTLKISDDLITFNFMVNGHTSAEADAPDVRLFRRHKNGDLAGGFEVSYHTPDNETAFDHYSNYLELHYADGKSYFNYFYFDLITTPVKPEINFKLSGNTLSEIDLTVSGDAYDVLIGHYYTEHDGFEFYWRGYSADEDIEFPLIPTELTSAFSKFSNANLVFKEALVTFQARDYDHLDGYQTYLETLSGRTGKTLKDGGTYNTTVNQTF